MKYDNLIENKTSKLDKILLTILEPTAVTYGEVAGKIAPFLLSFSHNEAPSMPALVTNVTPAAPILIASKLKASIIDWGTSVS